MTIIDAFFLFAVMSVLALLPSASVALVVTRSATAGLAHGAAVAVGIVLGDLVFVCLAVLGMAAVAEVMGGFFVAIKYVAGAYLIWFGLSLLRSNDSSPSVSSHQNTSSLSASFLSGLLVTLGDIKAIFFYASLFPAFVDLSRLSLLDVGFVFVITLLSVGGVKLGYAYGATKVVTLAKRFGPLQSVKVVGGGIMIGIGGWLIAKA